MTMVPAARFAMDLASLCDPARDRILAAVSGGADSLALLLLLREAVGDRCEAATVDHGLRPGARAEAEQVAAICATLGVPHAILSGALPDRVAGTANLSARARALRYELLEEHARARGCDLIATGHQADDQVETLVMRLNRGAGVAGLAGVRASAPGRIRPLLGWRRAELAALVADAGLPVVDDPANGDDRFTRARLRRALAGADWLSPARWAQSAAALGDAEGALAWAAEAIARRAMTAEDDAIVLVLSDEPRELVRRLVLACLVRVDPGIAPRGDELTRLTDLILATERRADAPAARATLGQVVVKTRFRPETGLQVRFTPAPPRRTG